MWISPLECWKPKSFGGTMGTGSNCDGDKRSGIL
jgi:hypothetical protein